MSTQNLKVALHVPMATPSVGDNIKVTAVSAGNLPTTAYSPAGSASSGGTVLPTAPAAGKFLISGSGSTFPPTWADADGGRF